MGNNIEVVDKGFSAELRRSNLVCYNGDFDEMCIRNFLSEFDR